MTPGEKYRVDSIVLLSVAELASPARTVPLDGSLRPPTCVAKTNRPSSCCFYGKGLIGEPIPHPVMGNVIGGGAGFSYMGLSKF